MFETIRYDVTGPVATLTLNRPDKLNAINGAMVRELNLALDRAEDDDGVRVVLLNGAGRAFSSGFDLQTDADARDVDAVRDELRRDLDLILRFWDCPKPTVAAVHKYCLGSAMEMAVACDVTVAAEDCRFGAPEVRFGSGIVCLILPWLVGLKAAKELLLTGDDRVTARRALEIGLINMIVPPDRLDEAAFDMARRLAANDPFAVRLTKQAINRTCDIMGLRKALLEALDIDVKIETTETAESTAFNAILEKDGVKAALAWREERIREASVRATETKAGSHG